MAVHLALRHQVRRRSPAVDAALVYVALRLVSAVVILLVQVDQPPVRGLSRAPYLGMLTHWDAQWFHSVATSGYPRHLPHDLTGAVAMNQWAIYPGFPFLTRGVMQVTDTGFATAASLVDLVCGLVAAIAIGRLLETRIPHTAALAVVAVWAALPLHRACSWPTRRHWRSRCCPSRWCFWSGSSGDALPWLPCSWG